MSVDLELGERVVERMLFEEGATLVHGSRVMTAVRSRVLYGAACVRGSLAFALAWTAARLSTLAGCVAPKFWSEAPSVDEAVLQAAAAIVEAEYWRGRYAALVEERTFSPEKLRGAIAQLAATARASTWGPLMNGH